MPQAAGDWVPICVFPNLRLKEAIDASYGAIVPADDPRVAALSKAQPTFRSFLRRFSTEFRERLEPSVFLRRSDAPSGFCTGEAVAGLRDVVALSSLPYGRALALAQDRSTDVFYADAFNIYPWMVDKHYEHLICNTSAMLGLHQVDRFYGQGVPGVPEAHVNELDFDKPLLTALVARWKARFRASKPAQEDVALFRSLNTANQASRMPSAAGETTIYDIGRLLALWVSALEILAHPRDGGKASQDRVLALLDRVVWLSKHCQDKRQVMFTWKKGQRQRRSVNMPAALCWRIYVARNKFLHGEPVSRADLGQSGSCWWLFGAAAPLYRMALSAYLGLSVPPLPSVEEPAAFGRAVTERMDFLSYQRVFEDALDRAARGVPH